MSSAPYPFEIPCPHMADRSIPVGKDLPNYHPLSREEIVRLLDFARGHMEDGIAIAAVEVRLCQGIPGMTCPRPMRDAVAEKSVELNRVFMDWYESGGASDIVEALGSLMRT